MDELVVLVNKRDEIIASIELERERATSKDNPSPAATATPEPIKGTFLCWTQTLRKKNFF